MPRYRTTRDALGRFSDVSYGIGTVPAGTEVEALRDGLGRVFYAVRSATLVAQITGNKHDSVYRYFTVPENAVESFGAN